MRSHNITKGKMAASIIGIAVATLLIIFAFSGRYAEGGFRQFGNFFLGTFGMCFYGLMAAVIVACSFTLAGKSIRIPGKYAAFFVTAFVAIVLFVHTLTTTYLPAEFSNDQGSGYIQLVYNYYDKEIGVPTFGGVVFGIIAWALERALTIYGAMIVIVALLSVSVYFVGMFFYSYFTGKITLQSKHEEEDVVPDDEPFAAVHTTEGVRDNYGGSAYSILFENQPYPEEVSSTPTAPADKFPVAPQSTLDDQTPSRAQAESILFGDAAVDDQQPAPQQQSSGNSFFRPNPQPKQNDDFIVRGFYNTPDQSAKPQQNPNDSWKVSGSAVSNQPGEPTFEKEPSPFAPLYETDYTKETPVQSQPQPVQQPSFEQPVAPRTDVQPQPQTVFEQNTPEHVDITDVVAEEPTEEVFSDDTPVTVEQQEPDAPAVFEQTQEVQEPQQEPAAKADDNEIVAIPGETVIQTPVGDAVQARMDFVTQGELKKAEEKVHKYPKYINPPSDLLNDVTIVEDNEADNRARAAEAITKKLANLDIKVELADIVVGPSVTRYMFNVLSEKTRMNKFVGLSNDIKACVEAQDDIRIEAPVQGTNMVGIEVPNKVKRPVVLRTLLESETFKKAKGHLVFGIGQEITGKVIVADLADMPHLLVAGTTGSGKSVVLNCLIVSLMYKYGPEYVRFVMVDPKFVELSRYNGIPHMLTSETITTPNDALAGMDYLINEMEARYQLFRQNGVGNISEYNSRVNPRIAQKLPYLVFIVDELADLMAASKQAFEAKLQRLAQKSRAAGIHIVLATQRPDVKTITGTIKANLPCRIALKVSSQPDSMTIINGSGAEKLLGKGDMLYMSPGSASLERVQGAYVSNDEIRELVKFMRESNEVYYDDSISDQIFVSQKQQEEAAAAEEAAKGDSKDSQVDPLCKKALRFWLERNGGKASIASIQRALGIGFNRAGRIMDTLQRLKYVETLPASEPNSKPTKVLITLEDLDGIFQDLPDD